MNDNIYKNALDKWGYNTQLDVLVEELSELIFAIQKYKRTGKKEWHDNVCEEVADVRLMLKQAEFMFDEELIHNYYKEKKDRVIERLKEK